MPSWRILMTNPYQKTMEHKTTKEEKTMKKKKPYIAPEIKIIPMDIENLMGNPTSWNVYDENGNPTGDGGSVIEGNPGEKPGGAKENPFSGPWELDL
jgi:hypothetical protein